MIAPLQPRVADLGPRFSPVAWLISAGIVATVFEGAVRKWVIPGSSPALQAVAYFSKDVPLLIALLMSVRRPAPPGRLHTAVAQVLVIGTLLYVGGAIAALHGFAPVGAVVSARNALLLPWLAYCSGRALIGRSDLHLIVHTIGICAVVNAILGSVQFTLPPTHWLNAQVSTYIEAVGSVGRIRASGTFSYMNALADLCTISCWAAGVGICANPRNWTGYAYALAGLTCASAAISRGGVLNGLTILAISMIFHPKLRFLALILALVGTSAAVTMESDSPEFSPSEEVALTSAVLARHRTSGDSLVERSLYMYTTDLYDAVISSPFGVGLGRGQSGQGASESQTGIAVLSTYEGEPGRLVFEVGVVGFLGVVVIRVGFLLLFIHNRPPRKLLTNDFREVVWVPTIALLILSCVFGSQVVFNHFAATFQMVASVCVLAAAHAQPVTNGNGRA